MALSCAGALAAAPTAQLVNFRKHLVLDTRVIAESNNVRLGLGPVEKDPRNPLFAADKTWENSLNNLYPNVAYANVYLGFLMMINTGSNTNVDGELTWSPDSVTWHRVNPGSQFIPHGPKGSYDWGCIYAQAGPPILKDGRLMIFHGGSTQLHIGRKRHCLPCLAWLRVDGFAGYEPGPGGKGRVTTQPLLGVGEPLRLSADAQGGTIRVAVLGEDGFELDRCQPVTGNVSDAEVGWQGGKSFAALKGKIVRLQFELDVARLYAFSGLERTRR
jgi:hypothetical protein